MKFAYLAALALGLPTLASADETMAGDLTIVHPRAFETPATAKTGAGYLTVVNDGEESDTLLAVQADFPKVMLHKTEEVDGVAKMSHVEHIAIPAGETVELAPGGYHVMFMGLDGDPFETGETIPATLVFEKAGEVAVEFKVEERDAKADHSSHD